MTTVRTVDTASFAALRPGLGELLVDSVHHGASVGFLEPLSAGAASGRP